jgi:predicted enzyme involved in methoxymalonyl-ACP biosynthesis
MLYKKLRPNEFVTYQDLVNAWYDEMKNRQDGKSSTEQYYKANRYNQFVKKFYENLQNKGKGRNQMIKAWEEFKSKEVF